MTGKVVVFATIVAKPGSIEQASTVLKGLLEPTRKEEGCLNYDMHTDDEKKNEFVFHETWLTTGHFYDHTKNQDFTASLEKLQPFVESVVVRRTTKL